MNPGSEVRGPRSGAARRPRLLFAATALAAMLFLPLPGGYDVFDSSIFLVVDDDRQDEDAYVLTDRGIVQGVIDGDLVIAAGDLTITGTVTGDVLVASAGTVVISGKVQGAVRGAARTVRIEESAAIGDDLAVAAVTTRVLGSVGRDAIVFGGRLVHSGEIGRDLHGRFVRGELDGGIGGNVDISTSSLDIGPEARVGGSLLYRSNRTADTDPAAVIEGTFKKLSPRPSFFVDVWWTLATILGFFAFLFTGILLIWLLRDTSARATRAIVTHPWRSLAYGVAALVLVPVVIWTFVFSFVGVPVAVLLALLYLLGFFFGPIPAVAAAGSRIPGGRGGLFAAFVIGAILWRLGIHVAGLIGGAVSIAAGALYLAALVWGLGGWAAAIWEGRGAGYSSPSAASTTART